MKFNVYAVKDELTGRFMEPQFFRSEEEAKRNFGYQVNNIKIWKDNASDWSLYKLAEFDEETAFMDSPISLEKVCGGRSMLKGE